LAAYFLERLRQKQGRALHLTGEAVERLLRYPWPGNVRELENAMERTAILIRSDIIRPEDLPSHIAAGAPLGPTPSLPREHTLAEVEKTHILQTLERCGWNHSRAAQMLGIGRTTLWRKLKEHQIEEGASPH
jgi:two-component system response regulator HydG